jgi:quercetin dioxygenase-like cupin family protein
MTSANTADLPVKVIENVNDLLEEIPEESIVSRTVWKADGLKTVLFGFDAGQALSDHSAGQPAVIHMLEGEAHITLQDEVVEAKPGTWIYMPARLPHSVTAHTPVKMLLLLLPAEASTENSAKV